FKLTEQAIDTIQVLAKYLGIKQKSLFDQLITDSGPLDVIAGEINNEEFDHLDRTQKTYVISRKTLSCLGEASEKFDTPRDALVEYSIHRLLPIISEEQKKHRKRKKILRELKKFVLQGDRMLRNCRTVLSPEDPVCESLEQAIRVCRTACADIHSFIEQGEIIETLGATNTRKGAANPGTEQHSEIPWYGQKNNGIRP
ncbi:MAG: hypothetical protein DRH37_09735, partial [Deltaproteobacteria bacterium]